MLKSINTYIVSNPKGVRRVQYVLIGLFIFLVAFDIFLAATNKPTISNVVKQGTENGFFVLTYFWGVLAVNLFITQKKEKLVHEITGTAIIIIIALTIVFLGIGKRITDLCIEQHVPILAHFISMVFGLIVGILFWRQKHKEI